MSLLSRIFRPQILAAAALLLSLFQHAARADVWGYIDAKGVAHFATERLDDRYELFYKGDQSFDTSVALPAAEELPRPVAIPTARPKLIAFFEISPHFKVVKHHMRDAANTHNIDYELLQALIATESGFDSTAVSPKGAVGLMQIMPATAERYGVASDAKTPVERKLTDPKVNIRTGTRYLRDLINMFPGQLELALAAYNAGEGAVQRAGNKIPNYKETQAYVKTVMQIYTMLKPPAPLAERRRAATRVRMELPGGKLGEATPGGAKGRGNMVTPLSAAPVQPEFKIERE
jgi:soluble lytic murein transglycosylase-like protein